MGAGLVVWRDFQEYSDLTYRVFTILAAWTPSGNHAKFAQLKSGGK